MLSPRRSLTGFAAFCAATACVCALPVAAHAQAATAAPQQTPDLPLLIAPPPGGGRVTLEVDARNDDVLGLVKDLLEGLTSESPSVKGKPAPAVTTKPKTAVGARKSGKPAPAVAPPKSPDENESGNEFVDMLKQAGITDVLRPISHIHVLVIKMPPPPAQIPANWADSDPVNFYSTGFRSEGGHLLVWSDQKSQLLIMGFDSPRKHFAVVSRSGSTITVVRADGYPDVKKLSKLITMFTGD